MTASVQENKSKHARGKNEPFLVWTIYLKRFGENEVEWIGKIEMNRLEALAKGKACYATLYSCSRLRKWEPLIALYCSHKGRGRVCVCVGGGGDKIMRPQYPTAGFKGDIWKQYIDERTRRQAQKKRNRPNRSRLLQAMVAEVLFFPEDPTGQLQWDDLLLLYRTRNIKQNTQEVKLWTLFIWTRHNSVHIFHIYFIATKRQTDRQSIRRKQRK